MPDTVYHYCSCETFLSIISKSTLRMTNIQKSNDYTEIINSLNIFRTALQTACYQFSRANPWDETFAKFFQNVHINELIENAIYNDSLTYYAVCFSEERDLLSQWRGYADDASGVAIGFNVQYLKELTDYRNMKYMAVEYNTGSVSKDLIQYVLEKLQAVQYDIRSEQTFYPSYYENALNEIITSFIYNAAFYKSSAFAEEKEWRIVLYPFGMIRNLRARNESHLAPSNQLYYDRMSEFLQGKSKHGHLIRSPINFGLRKNNIFTYFELDFSAIASFFVKEIVLGPKNQMDDLDLRLLLLSNGIDPNNIQITRSAATYQ